MVVLCIQTWVNFVVLLSGATRPQKKVKTEKVGDVKYVKLVNSIIILCFSCIVLRYKSCYI